MTGDLILRLDSEGRELDERRPGTGFESFNRGMLGMLRRMERSMDPDGAARTETRAAIEGLRTRAEKVAVIRGVKRALPRCESPIEKLLLPWLVAERYPWFKYSPKVLFPGEGAELGDLCIALIPQLPIGRFRVDFALAAKHGPHLKFIIVECDGKEFHDSPVMMQRDAERDAILLANRSVLEVIRFSGTDIYRSPKNCAVSAAACVYECWRKGNAKFDRKFSVAA